ncbi:hypothetical protein BLNAU_24452 [Blattamonas nauphoetae]|uniref:Uncharacterized protein n=1 Tax=Blattamonas nauphoetae TaxID=2049346 RepID=A0ABQ9WMU1_9EUKA|nr:hypothetical protein BLNAU_24452 [Blattamonas nauphoetae]
MLSNNPSSDSHVENIETNQKIFLGMFLRQICGDSKPLRPTMLKSLLVLVSERDWALSTMLDVEYIKPLEEYCEKTQLCDVPVEFPKLLFLIDKSSEGDCLRICESSLPSILLDWMISISDKNMFNEIGHCLVTLTSTLRSSSTFLAHHKTQFLAFIDHCESAKSSLPYVPILAPLCFSPHLEVSKMALKALNSQSKSDSATRSFLQTLEVPSGPTENLSELVPFAGRLCATLTEHVSQIKPDFSESSPSDGTPSVLSVNLPEESPWFTGTAKIDVLCPGLALLHTLRDKSNDAFLDILIDSNFVPLLKTSIIACLDMLEDKKRKSSYPHADITDLSITVLNLSWLSSFVSLDDGFEPLYPIVGSAFCDVPQLCSLLERTCRHSTPTHTTHLSMIINVTVTFPHLIPRLLEERLVERVIDTSKPMTIHTTFDDFHLSLIWAIANLIVDPTDITKDKEEWKRIRKLQFERVLKPAKRYLQFVLQREESIPPTVTTEKDLQRQIVVLLAMSNDNSMPVLPYAFRFDEEGSYLDVLRHVFDTPSVPSFSTLQVATAHLVESDPQSAFVVLVFDKEVWGWYEFVVEEEGEDVIIVINTETGVATRSPRND